MGYNYLILGAGRQGTAAAYDLASFGEANRIVLADQNDTTASKAADRVNELTGKRIAEPAYLDVTNRQSLKSLIEAADSVMSAVPYRYNLEITKAAIACRAHLADLGGNTPIVWEQLKLDKEAKEAGVSVVPDCGMGPGLINTLGAFAIELLDEPEEIFIYDAGLPQNPQPPWNYELSFHINGLTNEMDGKAAFIREGQVVYIDTLSEPEFIEFPPFGRLEADVTSGGTSTAPWTFLGKIRRYENKVMRYPGHYEWLRAYKTLGLFSEEPVRVNGCKIPPRELYHTLLEPKITPETVRDVSLLRVRGIGKKDGNKSEVVVDIVDYFDEKTGFTSMERLTGWHCSIMMIFQAKGKVQPGCTPVETAVPPTHFIDEIRNRGISYSIRWI